MSRSSKRRRAERRAGGVFRKRMPPVGAGPGALAPSEDAGAVRLTVIEYDPAGYTEEPIANVEDLARWQAPRGIAWIEVEGLGDQSVMRRIGELFSIHPLALADLVNVPQRPKAETFDEHELVICRMPLLREGGEIELEQVGLVIGPRWVISFQEGREDCFDPVRERIRGNALIRRMEADYLAYAMIDLVIDAYYPAVESLGDVLEALEEEVVGEPTRATLATIHGVRRQLLVIHRLLWQQRDALGRLLRGESPRIGTGVRVYLRDAYDHVIQLIDVVESYREMAVSLMEVYLSSVSNRLNEVMKVLTVMSTIFIPLTFLVGVYGMNFQYMPELHQPWAYPALWVAMLAIAATMVWLFRRRGWIGRSARLRLEPHEGPDPKP